MSNSDDEAYEAEQAKRLAREKRLEELEEAKKLNEDPDRDRLVREEVQKLREKAKQKEREKKNGVDSDDDDAKEDEAMEGEESDHDEENSEPGVSDSDKDPSEPSEVDIEEHEEKSRRKVAQKFMDIDAELSEEDTKEYFKSLKKKHGKSWRKFIEDDEDDKARESDLEFIDDEVRYDTEVEEERKKRKKKEGKGSPEKPKKSKEPKRKRIDTDEEGSDKGEDEEEKKEVKPKKPQAIEVTETDDSAIENMALMEKENTTNKKSAKFHEHADIAKAASDKKNKSVDPASLVYSPKKTKPEKKPTNSPANGSSKKKKPKGDKPTYEVGYIFENGKSVFRVTHRAPDFPMLKGNSGIRVVDNSCHDITLLTTCEMMETRSDGTYKHTGQFELFFVNKETKPKKVQPAGATAMWEAFSEKNPEKAKKLVLQACDCDNLADKCRLLLPPNVWKKVIKECHKDNSEWKWQPRAKNKAAPTEAASSLPPSTPTLSSGSSFSVRIEQAATPPGSEIKKPQAAPPSGTSKSNGNAAKKQKTTASSDTHDIAKMMQRAAPRPAAPAAAAAAAMDDDNSIFGDIFASMAPIKKHDMFDKNRSSMIDLVVGAVKALQEQHPNKELLRKKYSEIGLAADKLKDTNRSAKEKVVLMTNLLEYVNGQPMHPLWAILFFMPFVSEEAAVVTRSLIFNR